MILKAKLMLGFFLPADVFPSVFFEGEYYVANSDKMM